VEWYRYRSPLPFTVTVHRYRSPLPFTVTVHRYRSLIASLLTVIGIVSVILTAHRKTDYAHCNRNRYRFVSRR
jgi:hypothetical protein